MSHSSTLKGIGYFSHTHHIPSTICRSAHNICSLLNPHIRCYTSWFLVDLVQCAHPSPRTHTAATKCEFSTAHLCHVLCTKWRLLEFVWTNDKKMHTNFRIVHNFERCKWKMQGAFGQEFIDAVEMRVLELQSRYNQNRAQPPIH